MPYYYDPETGDMEFTENPAVAAEGHILSVVRAHRYPLSPETTGQLFRVLGPAPLELSRAEAMSRVRMALATLGLTNVPVETAIEVLDDSWRMLLGIGT